MHLQIESHLFLSITLGFVNVITCFYPRMLMNNKVKKTDKVVK